MWKYSHIVGVYRYRPRGWVLPMAKRLRIISRARVARKKPMTISASCGPRTNSTGCVMPNKIIQNDHRKGSNTNWQRPIRKVI
jgi:hypothetical protein